VLWRIDSDNAEKTFRYKDYRDRFEELIGSSLRECPSRAATLT